MGQLDGKVAVVTGGSSGIGLATVQRFAAEGASVVVADLQEGPEGDAFVRADVGDPADWPAIVAAAEKLGGLDVAYLNAGVTTGEPDITALTDDQYRRIMNV